MRMGYEICQFPSLSLQNPDLIMVHYLEHSGNSQETDSMQMTEVR